MILDPEIADVSTRTRDYLAVFCAAAILAIVVMFGADLWRWSERCHSRYVHGANGLGEPMACWAHDLNPALPQASAVVVDGGAEALGVADRPLIIPIDPGGRPK